MSAFEGEERRKRWRIWRFKGNQERRLSLKPDKKQL